MAGVAHGVGARGAATRLVQAGTAARADPAGLDAVVRGVGAGLALGAEGVAAPAAALDDAPAGRAAAAVRVATVVAQVAARLAALELENIERLIIRREAECISLCENI